MYTAYATLYTESHYITLGPIRRSSSLALGTMGDVVQEEEEEEGDLVVDPA